MAYLFVDTSNHLTFGLLNESFEWVDYVELQDKKSSGKIHAAVFEMLEKQSLKAKDLDGLFQISGPGSYTGMRVSEGLAQVFEWQKIPSYSFYHFEVPKLLGIKSGAWISNAFKGELFIYSWNELQAEADKSLVAISSLDEKVNELKNEFGAVYTHFEKEFDVELQYSSSLMKENSQKLFKKVLEEKIVRKPFYYRSLEQEFKSSKK